MMNSGCYKCLDRYVGCHSNCKKYKEYKEHLAYLKKCKEKYEKSQKIYRKKY